MRAAGPNKDASARPKGRPRKYEGDAPRFLLRFPSDVVDELRKLADKAPAAVNDLVVLSVQGPRRDRCSAPPGWTPAGAQHPVRPFDWHQTGLFRVQRQTEWRSPVAIVGSKRCAPASPTRSHRLPRRKSSLFGGTPLFPPRADATLLASPIAPCAEQTRYAAAVLATRTAIRSVLDDDASARQPVPCEREAHSDKEHEDNYKTA